jgi:hypothetical protein
VRARFSTIALDNVNGNKTKEREKNEKKINEKN